MAQKCTDCGKKRKGTSRAARRRGGNWTCGRCISKRKPHRQSATAGRVRRQGAFSLEDKTEPVTPQNELVEEPGVDRDTVEICLGEELIGTRLYTRYKELRAEAGFKLRQKRRHFDNIVSQIRVDLRNTRVAAEKAALPTPEPEPQAPTGISALLDGEPSGDTIRIFDDAEEAWTPEDDHFEAVRTVSSEIFDDNGRLLGREQPEEAADAVTATPEAVNEPEGVQTPPEAAQTPEKAPEAPEPAKPEPIATPVATGASRIEQLRQLMDTYIERMDAATEEVAAARHVVAAAEESHRQLHARLQPRLLQLSELLDSLEEADQWLDDEGAI